MKAGDKWGALTCIQAGTLYKNEMALDADGKEYVASSQPVQGYVFRCACGREFELSKREFRGKRVVRDCGCGRGATGGGRVIVSFSCTPYMYQLIRDYATMDRQSISYTITESLRRLFEIREVEGTGLGLDEDSEGQDSEGQDSEGQDEEQGGNGYAKRHI